MIHPLFDLSGRVAVISGAGRGLGRSMAIAFAEFGADVLLTAKTADGVQATAEYIRGLGRRAIATTYDITEIEQIQELFALLDREYGRIDILANVFGPGHQGRPEDIPVDVVDRVLHGLVTARFYCCQEAGRRMLASGKGSIINIGSIASLSGVGRGNFAYTLGMSAVAQMTRELSVEWAGRGVRVNAILPAQVINPGLQERMDTDPNLEATFLRGIPIGRLGVPDDIKGVAVLLASDASSWITGALIPLDGGNLAMNAGATPGPRK